MPEKYEKEIEELLRGLGEKSPSNGKRDIETPLDDAPIVPNHPPRSSANQGKPRPGSSLSANKIMLLGLILLLIGFVSPIWKLFLVLAGLGFIFGGFTASFFKPRTVAIEKRWRGQLLEEEPTPWEKLRRWMKK